MASFIDMAAELQLSVVEQLTDDGKTMRQLAQTCKQLRNLLAPFVFRRLTLASTERSTRSIQHISDGPFARLVRILHY